MSKKFQNHTNGTTKKANMRELKRVKNFCFAMMSNTQSAINYLKERYEVRFNLGNKKVEYRAAGSKGKYEYLDEYKCNSIWVQMSIDNIACTKDALYTILESDQFPSYDPYKEFIDSLPIWDMHDYMKDLAQTVHTSDDKYFEWCLRKWLTAFIASLADEDVVNHTALILCGGQGIGKTTWFNKIIPAQLKEFTSQGAINLKDKETLIQLAELCLYNMDEVANLNSRDIESLKQLITQKDIYLRRAYTKRSSKYVRRCSFCGTSNEGGILYDVTGNRRFLCQEVNSIDLNFKIDLQQLYAQAYHSYKCGWQFWFDETEQKCVEEHNAKFRQISVEEELIQRFFEPCQDGEEGSMRLQASEITDILQAHTKTKLISSQIGKILSALHFNDIKTKGCHKWIVKEKKE